MKRFLTALGGFASLTTLTLVTPALAQVSAVPAAMIFQGRLAKPDGTPVADGTYTIRFSLFDSLSGGIPLWRSTNADIPVRNGTFSTRLGFGSGYLNLATQASVFAKTTLYLDLSINGGASLTPRQPFASVAFALKADAVKDGAITSASVADESITNSKIAPGSLTADRFASGALNGTAWLLGGNGGVTGSFLDTFLGTTDNRPLVFKTNNVERFRLLSNGNTGIGTTNPQSPLHVAGAAGIIIGTSALDGGYTALKFSLSQASGGYALIQAIKSAGGAYGDLNLNPVGGSVGIGTINPAAKLEVNNGGGTGASLKLEHRGSNFIVRPYEAGSDTTVLENTAGYLSINSNIGVRERASTNVALKVAGGQTWSIYAEGNIFASTGYSDNGYYLTSDARFKRNIETVPDALSHLLALRGVTYEMNRAAFPDRNFTEGKHLGFIAQEMEKVLPQLVKTGNDGFKAVNYEGVIPVTVEAIKTLNARTLLQQNQMEALSKENATIKADNAEMKAELDALKSAVRQLQQNRK